MAHTQATPNPNNPGIYLKTHVLPAGLTVKAAAALLGVGRPALSNLLNGKAALSPEMALRFEKAFGADSKTLLEKQAQFDQTRTQSVGQNVAVRTYVPPFLKITARDIETWADANLEARSHLAVFLRKLVNSPGEQLSRVDFPGYDNAQRKGWDGVVEAGAATPWIPLGKSGWEFGCDKLPKKKAEHDYAARVKAVPAAERLETTFIFVTPRNWAGKESWQKDKLALNEWKTIRVYDASDLEQWLEQSVATQGWVAKQIGLPNEGVHSLDEEWDTWASATVPPLAKDLFELPVKIHQESFLQWLKNPPSKPLIVCADSRAEALAFLACMFETNDASTSGYKDRAVVFSSADTAHKLLSRSSNFIPIVFSDAVEQKLGGIPQTLHTIIVRPRNTVEPTPDVVLDLLGYEAFSKALAAMGIDDHHRVEALARESGQSPTVLRRRLSEIPAIKTPPWAQDHETVRRLIPIMLVGAWNAQSEADRAILSRLAGQPNSDIEKQIAALLTFDDPPVWSVGYFRGVTSKIDSFFAVHAALVHTDLEDFLLVANIVLSETDPALELPEDKRVYASFYGKTREHSRALREGICETLVLLAVHGNNLFGKRLGINVEDEVNGLIRGLLTPLTPNKLHSHSGDLPMYAEAAPQEFLKIVEEDLKSADPQVYCLMKPADTGIFGSCPRTGLLWALENLAWNPQQLLRTSLILAKLAERQLKDNWANKPDNSLASIYRSWLPQTAASLEERQRSLETLTKRFPHVGWQICLNQFDIHPRIGNYSHRPRWRSDASGAGHGVTRRQDYEFVRKALDLALAWLEHDENTLGDLVSSLQGLAVEDQYKVWDLVELWAKTADDQRKAILRERIRRFALTQRSKQLGISEETRDRAREVSALLIPQDIVIRHEWLFKDSWVESSADELEEGAWDFEKSEARIASERNAALHEIWSARGFDGLQALASKSSAPARIGWHLADGVISQSDAADFLRQCLDEPSLTVSVNSINEVIRGFLMRLEADRRLEIIKTLLQELVPSEMLRLLKSAPFERETWLLVDAQDPKIHTDYWHDIFPGWINSNSPDINELVERLLAAHRPRAAFAAVHFSLERVETALLKRLLRKIATSTAEPRGTYLIDGYHLSSALDILQKRPGVSRDEMAQLEFLFIRALDHSQHGIPNLAWQISESPALFVQALALVFKRNDGGQDPPEWQIEDSEQRSGVRGAAYSLLEHAKRIPGTDDTGRIKAADLKAWVIETRALCAKYGRVEIGDQKIGQLLAAAPAEPDGVWPCSPVRDVLEAIGTKDIAIGVSIGRFNARGFHSRGIEDGGRQERALAAQYRNWSRQLAFEYPYVSDVLEQIATRYDQMGTSEDLEVGVRRRLMH
jgi:addiction module HigA family antidote